VNLPSFVKTYAGRVVESMAIGQPVVSWRIPPIHERRGCSPTAGKSCCSMATTPDRLADALQTLRDDPERTRRIAAAGLANARKHHTSEHRVSQISSGSRPASRRRMGRCQPASEAVMA
jgi:glycosyltransferase involved in cell wall biosynthesis